MEGAVFPYEIFELILQHCDATTLTTCERVCFDLKILISKLDKRHKLWEKRALIDLPQYLHSKLAVYSHDPHRYQILIKNLICMDDSFENLKMVKEISHRATVRVTSAVFSGDYVICGTDHSSLFAVDIYGDIKYRWRRHGHPIQKLHVFFESKYEDNVFAHRYLVVSFGKQILLLYLNDGFYTTNLTFRDVQFSSFYDNFIAHIDSSGYLKIEQIPKVILNDNNLENGLLKISIIHVKSIKFFTPTCIFALDIWDKMVTYVKNNGQVYHFNYKLMDSSENMLQISDFKETGNIWVANSEVVFYLNGALLKIYYKAEKKQEEIVNEFNTMTILQGVPTCISMYVNILFIGTDHGMLYIYRIKDWNCFKLKNYIKSFKVKGQRIHSVDVQELKNTRVLCIGHQKGISLLGENLDYELNEIL